MKQALFLLAFAVVVAASCRKKPVDTPDPVKEAGTGMLRLAFRNVVGSQNVVIGSTMYTTASGDSFSISKLKYFISNIELLDASGTAMKPSPTYNLIDEAGSHVATADSFSTGTYTQVRFLIGVDSTRNVSGAQTGDLDPSGIAEGMFWTWQTGYIMAMLEGASPQAVENDGVLPDNPAGSLTFHMGGFTGRNNVLRTVTLPLPSPAVIRAGKTTELHITSDVRQWFSSPNTISFAATSSAMGGEMAAKIADNYTDMFTVTEVHNEE